ncbi:MAG TPA: hypothetical protein VLL52_19390 [Anaerolineae bacterium]|nr:hypothetical protein [Anaerolineae bacterium]
MCMFSGNVGYVGKTKIFARGEGERQYLVYEMTYEAEEALAMILPVPVPRGTGEDGVSFINLEGYPKFFEDLAGLFANITRSQSRHFGMVAANLAVVEVGSFIASFVPTIGDFERLSPQFQLDEGIWSQLPQYQDYGFVVFQLDKGRKHVHPMAFSFPRRDSSRLFFPTVHVHEGDVPDKAEFEHDLYCQWEGDALGRVGEFYARWQSARNRVVENVLFGMQSELEVDEHHLVTPIGMFDFELGQGVVAEEMPLYMAQLRQMYANEDVWVG